MDIKDNQFVVAFLFFTRRATGENGLRKSLPLSQDFLIFFIFSGLRKSLRIIMKNIEAATRGVLGKKVFLEISQNSQENTCVRVSLLITSFLCCIA